LQAKVDQTLRHPGPTASVESLRGALEAHTTEILQALELYVAKSGLARHPEAAEIALELLGELAAEALGHADRYDPARLALPWFLGIGANMVKRRLVEEAKHQRREPRVQDLAGRSEETMSDDDLFDLLCGTASPSASEALEAQARIDSMLAPVSDEDQQVVRLAVLLDLDSEAVAKKLGIKPGAARTRLSRALARLRRALTRQARQAGSEGDE
jgi:RNA polymerase sigma-70 factor (ECF subfamily)